MRAREHREAMLALVLVLAPLACGSCSSSGGRDRSVHAIALDSTLPPQLADVVGTVATVRLASTNSDAIQKRLHFCLFDNGDDDYIYVGTKYGMWANGEFDLSNNGRVVFTGRVPNLLYSGVYIPMGAVLSNQPGSNISIEITRVTGWFK